MRKINYIYANLPSYRRDFFNDLSKILEDKNIDLEVLHGTPTDKKNVKHDKYGFYKKKSFTSQIIKVGPLEFIKIPKLLKYLKKNKPDAIVISYMSSNITMLWIVLFCLLNKIPYATWRCGYNRPDYTTMSAKLREFLINFVEKRASFNIAYGSYYKKKLIKKGIAKEKIIIAQNTINVEQILNENKNFQKQFSLIPRILFVGALIKGKLLKSSIDAIKLLIDENYNVHFDIIGSGEIIDELREYTKKLNLESYISIPGAKYGDEVKSYFREADVFLLAGTGGLALNEAMAYGLPIISSNADGTGCDLVDGNGYFLEKYGDAQLQYECLKNFIKLSSIKKEQMSEISKDIIMSKASLKNMVNKHAYVCEKLLERDN